MEKREKDGRGRRYCVTGASGYIGSWLVQSLLQQGCFVHATVRDPGSFFILFFWVHFLCSACSIIT